MTTDVSPPNIDVPVCCIANASYKYSFAKGRPFLSLSSREEITSQIGRPQGRTQRNKYTGLRGVGRKLLKGTNEIYI